MSGEELADRSFLARMFIDRAATLEEENMQIDESNGGKPPLHVNATETELHKGIKRSAIKRRGLSFLTCLSWRVRT